jgi:hypothetical protein
MLAWAAGFVERRPSLWIAPFTAHQRPMSERPPDSLKAGLPTTPFLVRSAGFSLSLNARVDSSVRMRPPGRAGAAAAAAALIDWINAVSTFFD